MKYDVGTDLCFRTKFHDFLLPEVCTRTHTHTHTHTHARTHTHTLTLVTVEWVRVELDLGLIGPGVHQTQEVSTARAQLRSNAVLEVAVVTADRT